MSLGWKVTDAEFVALLPFFETFFNRSVSDGMRWLLDQPEVQALIKARIRGALIQS